MKPVRIKYVPSETDAAEVSVDSHGKMGYFYAWGTEAEHVFGDTIINTKAIVSDDAGRVDMVYPRNIRFLDTPPQVLIAALMDAIKQKDAQSEVIKAVHGFWPTQI